MEESDRFLEALELADRLDRALIHYDPIQFALITSMYELKLAAPQQYSVFVLHYLKGMAVTQICLSLGVERNAVDQNLSRARRSLIKKLCRYEEIQTWLRATHRLEAAADHGSGEQGTDQE